MLSLNYSLSMCLTKYSCHYFPLIIILGYTCEPNFSLYHNSDATLVTQACPESGMKHPVPNDNTI